MSIKKDAKQVGKAVVGGQVAGGIAGLIGLALCPPLAGLCYLGAALYASHQISDEDTEPVTFHLNMTETSSTPRRK